MSYLENLFKRTVKTREFPDEEGYLAEKVLKYKKKHSGYVGQLTKAINEIDKCFNKNDLSQLKLVSAIFKRQMYFFVISNEVHWQEI